MINTSVPAEEEHLPLFGKVAIQGLVFTWAREAGAVLKVHHPQYGARMVQLERHYEPEVLAKLIALSMIGNGPAVH